MLRLLVPLLVAFALPAQSPTQPSVDAARLAAVARMVEGEVTAGHYAGAAYLVLHQGEEVAFANYGLADIASKQPFRRDTIARIYSMTKAVTAVAALTLVEADVIHLDSPITRWLPELAKVQVFVGGTADAPKVEPAREPITVRMLLNHTAGFSYDFYRDSPVAELYRRADLWGSATLDEFLSKVATLPLVAQPGSRWTYSISLDVLGVLIERASKQPFADYVRDHVTAPLGMKDTDFDVPEGKRERLATLHTTKDGKLEVTEPTFGVFAEPGRGFAAGGAGLFSTLDDYAAFCSMLLENGTHRGVRILSRKTMELATADSLRGPQTMDTPGDGFGLLCAVRSDPAAAANPGSLGMLYWGGAATTTFFVDPREGLVGVLFCQHVPYDPQNLLTRFRSAIYTALR